MSRRLACFVDGFNLYHSLSAAQERHPDKMLKWLDLRALCRGFVPLVASDAILVSVDHFTAIPLHLVDKDPARVRRHQLYLRALSAQRHPAIRILIASRCRRTFSLARLARTRLIPENL